MANSFLIKRWKIEINDSVKLTSPKGEGIEIDFDSNIFGIIAEERMKEIRDDLLTQGNFEGYDRGHDEGYEEGKEEGFLEGEASGISEGYDRGYEEGLERGKSETK